MLSEIVYREVLKHIEQKITESRAHAIKTINLSKVQFGLPQEKIEEIENLLLPKDTDFEIADSRVNEYMERTGIEIVRADEYTNLSDLVELYFNSKPPFSESGKKKSEFPDAIALASLEGWAKENKHRVIAVST